MTFIEGINHIRLNGGSITLNQEFLIRIRKDYPDNYVILRTFGDENEGFRSRYIRLK